MTDIIRYLIHRNGDVCQNKFVCLDQILFTRIFEKGEHGVIASYQPMFDEFYSMGNETGEDPWFF